MADYKETFDKAVEAGKKRDYQTAIKLLTEVVSSTDELPVAYLYLGRSYHAAGMHDKAINILEHYLQLKPGAVHANLFLGRAYLAYGLYKPAVMNLKKVVEAQPKMYVAQSYLGLAFLKLKRPEIAVQHFENAVTLCPGNMNIFNGYLNSLMVKSIKYFYREKFEEARQMFEFILKNRDDAFVAHLYLARIYKDFGEYEKSLLHYEKTCAHHPDDPVLKIQMASVLHLLGKSDEAMKILKSHSALLRFSQIGNLTPLISFKISALTAFREEQYKKAIFYSKKVLKANYKDFETHAIMAESYHILGDLEKAKNHYNHCLKLKYSPDIHDVYMQILWQQEDYSGLLNDVRKILHNDPKNQIAAYFYALVLVYTDAAPEKILKNLQAQIHHFGPDPLLMSNLGYVYNKYGMPDLAENWLLRSLQLVDDDYLSLFTLISVYTQLDKKQKLKKHYDLYFKHFPEDRPQKRDYIKLLIQMKQFKSAIKEINAIIPYEKNKSHMNRMLAQCYIKLEIWGEAILLLRGLLKEKPDSVEILHLLVYTLDHSGRRDLAIQLLEKAASYFKHSSPILSMLGVFYSKDKNYEKALGIFRNLLADYPGNWRIVRNIGLIYRYMGNKSFSDKFIKRSEKMKNLDGK